MIDIYLACPYNHESFDTKYHRFIEVCKAAGKLIDNRFTVFSPISQNHPINQYSETDIDWIEFDLSFLRLCRILVVLTLPGWKESKGVNKEIETAKELKKSIIYWDGKSKNKYLF